MQSTIFRNLILITLVSLSGTAVYGQSPDTAWLHQLPHCPCRNPDYSGIQLGDGWAKDKGNLRKYHQGAAASFRSYPAVKTKWGYSCQQCCYDSAGMLIRSGRGAGTPDKISACRGENKKGVMKVRFFGLIGHFFKDVRPWNKYMRHDPDGWKTYNQEWTPDAGNNCN